MENPEPASHRNNPGQPLRFADIKVLQVDHFCNLRALFHSDRAVFIHTGEVSGVEQESEILPIHSVDEPEHSVGAVDKKAVIFHKGRDPKRCGVIGKKTARFDRHWKFALKIERRIRLQRSAEGGNIVAHGR